MIPLKDIKPFPCLTPGSAVVADPQPEGPEVTNASVTAAIAEDPEAVRGALFRQPSLAVYLVMDGWTDLGDGSFAGNIAGNYHSVRFDVADLVDGGVYLVSAQIIAHTSGNIQGPGLSLLGGSPITYHSVLGAVGVNATCSSIFVWRTGLPTQIAIRSDLNFVGTVGNITLVRIA
jgi:hypothetical protein